MEQTGRVGDLVVGGCGLARLLRRRRGWLPFCVGIASPPAARAAGGGLDSPALDACCSGQKSPPQVSTLNSEWKKKSRLAGVRPVLISGKNHETRFI